MAFERLRGALRRLLDDIRFALGTAIAAAAVGAVIGALAPIPETPLLPGTAPWANRLVAVAELALWGWFVGALWGFLLALWGRRLAPRHGPRARTVAVVQAAAAAVAVAVPVLLAHQRLAWAVGGAIVAATGVALATLALAREPA